MNEQLRFGQSRSLISYVKWNMSN